MESIKNYYQMISDHKDIVRNTIALQGIISGLKSDINFIANVRDYACSHWLHEKIQESTISATTNLRKNP